MRNRPQRFYLICLRLTRVADRSQRIAHFGHRIYLAVYSLPHRHLTTRPSQQRLPSRLPQRFVSGRQVLFPRSPLCRCRARHRPGLGCMTTPSLRPAASHTFVLASSAYPLGPLHPPLRPLMLAQRPSPSRTTPIVITGHCPYPPIPGHLPLSPLHSAGTHMGPPEAGLFPTLRCAHVRTRRRKPRRMTRT